ncbi:MAG: hypothetical protein ACR2LK_13710 [Solirubrobacteraceae bacterium]
MTGASPRACLRLVASAIAIALLATGCGNEQQSQGGEPAQATRTISAVLAANRVTVSPASFPARTIELLISNQTSTSRSVELRSGRLAAGGSPLVQRTGPIPPGGTSTLTATVDEGSYKLSAPGSGIDPATIAVSPPRENAIDRLIRP